MRSGTSLFLSCRAACLIGILLLSSTACSKDTSAEFNDTVPITDATRLAYKDRCARCHGEAGDGRGPDAAGLAVPLPDWTQSSVQSRRSDDLLRVVIVDGGTQTGRNAAMPPYPDLAGTLMLDEMIALIRTFE